MVLLTIPSGGFRGGDGGCIPPHQPKSNDFGRKISLNFAKLGSISGRISPPTSLNLTISGEKSLSISVKTFFFLFWRPPDFGRKKRLNFRFRAKNHSQFRCRLFFFFFYWRPPDFGRKKRLNFRFRPKNHSQFRCRPFFFFFFLETT